MKVLIIDEMHESIIPLLNEIKLEVDYMPKIERHDIISIIGNYDGLIVRSKTPIDEALLGNAQKLKFVGRAGAGVDNVEVEALKKRKIQLINAPEGNRDALAEHAIGMILTLFNKINIADQEVRNGIWDREGNRGVELMGKTIGLIGYGNMGEAFAKRLSSFGCKILAYDSEKTGFSNEYVKEVNLEEIFKEAQILSLHIPMNLQNKGLINYEFLNKFSNLDYLINTSRGEVLVLKDLLKLLKDGEIKGAALDVLENEKIRSLASEELSVFQEITQLKQVLFTPHVAGWSFESYEKINKILYHKIKKLIRNIDNL
ncbi:NAD(P)-dependent oxidoreductase [Marivirga harenae]|uniref:NAD(P)-dependent oxidoreductase n=1 Tax=Marivirga harenae TaxID=2010992 RepID=UPI0026DFBC0A|nr:NAD(P)-dependent oxidoreductase [Marivirga harenae]WKV10663.1 NAD(P)-dependent oxidoreductase [Marivirga harenae]|tara:strand:- start:47840 stop:48784 length:945 start_codon:yes stop_codon:yes gene_type:complete